MFHEQSNSVQLYSLVIYYLLYNYPSCIVSISQCHRWTLRMPQYGWLMVTTTVVFVQEMEKAFLLYAVFLLKSRGVGSNSPASNALDIILLICRFNESFGSALCQHTEQQHYCGKFVLTFGLQTINGLLCLDISIVLRPTVIDFYFCPSKWQHSR